MTEIYPAQPSRPPHPRLLGIPLPWALAMLVPIGLSLQLVLVSNVMSIYADDLAWEFVTERWVWSRLALRLLYAAQLCLLLSMAVWVVWCIVSLVKWIIRRVRR